MKPIKDKVEVKKQTKNRNKPRTTLTIKQQRFVDNYIETGNATESAERVYKTKSRKVSMAIGNENLGKPMIKASIEERVQKAKDIIYQIAMKEEAKESDRIKAAQDIIDRAEGKALARTEHSGEIKILSEDELLD